jgi:CheY-like chemotaxis protein
LRAVPPAGEPEKHVRALILVVEDDRLIRSTIRQLLSRMDYQTIVAEDGASAVAAARGFEGDIDLLLSDLVLPDTNGAEIAKLILQERPGIKVLFMSAYPADLLVQQGRIAPGTRTLEKPFDEEALARAVQVALRTTRTTEMGAAPVI